MESEGMIVESNANNVLFEPAIYAPEAFEESDKMDEGQTDGSVLLSTAGTVGGVDASLFAIHKM